MQLRSYSSLGFTDSVVPALVAGFAGDSCNHQCVLVNMDGTTSVAGYLQIHDLASKASLSSGVTVPLKTFKVAVAGPLPSLFGELGGITLYNGLCVALSTTPDVYTTSTAVVDIFGEISEFELPINGLTEVKASTTNKVVVWNNASGPNRVYRVKATNNDATLRYIMLFAKDAPANGEFPLRQWTLAISGSQDLRFGEAGYAPMQQDSAGVNYVGCTFFISSTATTYTAVGGASVTWDAFYKAT